MSTTAASNQPTSSNRLTSAAVPNPASDNQYAIRLFLINRIPKPANIKPPAIAMIPMPQRSSGSSGKAGWRLNTTMIPNTTQISAVRNWKKRLTFTIAGTIRMIAFYRDSQSL